MNINKGDCIMNDIKHSSTNKIIYTVKNVKRIFQLKHQHPLFP